jgi:hypothetical protein
MPVITLGCPKQPNIFRWGMFPEKNSGVTRMQDKAGDTPAIEGGEMLVSSHERNGDFRPRSLPETR